MYGIYIDRQSPHSALRQICQQLRNRIEEGLLEAGTRLTSTRLLAKELGVARNVIIEVYEQLTAEGYLETRTGSGTYVAEVQFTSFATKSNIPNTMPVINESNIRSVDANIIDFASGVPSSEHFPNNHWIRCMKQAAEQMSTHNYGFGHIQGLSDLRLAISQYLFRAKGIEVDPNQIVIVNGATEGFLLIAKALSPQYQSIYIENPTIDFTRDIFEQMNYSQVPVDVDNQGMNMDRITPLAPNHLILVTPSHQFPTGSLLSIQRRHQAIRLVEEADTYLIEDDYDSEYRLRGAPVPPLQTLAPSRVLYVGTFSKTLHPSLRIGFLIVPPQLMTNILHTKEKLNIFTPLIIQRALSTFISEGHFESHVYSMKKLYKKRRALLIEMLQNTYGEKMFVLGDDAGLHLQLQFHLSALRDLPWHDTLAYGFRVERTDEYLSPANQNHTHQPGILIIYGNLSEAEIIEGVKRMAAFTNSLTTQQKSRD
ncbi:PLP-dependent aminotransferase family protein [Paenibacillus sp. N1-5-1-14]|uniref:MocR-like pyridoxine biosynthesis transcription factor PdxR n=1 Tax=Paenibacillus radicibacter TaxID=2972488 RepID=UPI002158BADD|nr:PLP-dependent aminotransferase family protein [Paenibacillus radicibacter]MCR8644252.1 PLP-dependent aminotransferase family protein [Paenibacillus radicibacter]